MATDMTMTTSDSTVQSGAGVSGAVADMESWLKEAIPDSEALKTQASEALVKADGKKPFKQFKKELLETRAAAREKWEADRREKYEQFLVNLASDADKMLKAYVEYLVGRATVAAKRNSPSFKVWHYETLDEITHCLTTKHDGLKAGVKPSTFFTGFWDKERKRHSQVEFWEAGVDKLLLARLQEVFKAKGYQLKDVSDPSKSFNKVLEMTLEAPPKPKPKPKPTKPKAKQAKGDVVKAEGDVFAAANAKLQKVKKPDPKIKADAPVFKPKDGEKAALDGDEVVD